MKRRHTKKTHEEYEQELFEKEIDYWPIERYKTANTPIFHECLKGHKWIVLPTNILRGSGCPHCKGLVKKTTEQYNFEIESRGFKAIDDYVNDNTHITHQCSKGHQWRARPTMVLGGTGCPTCSGSKNKGVYSPTFFKNNPEIAKEPGVLYCVVLVDKKSLERTCIKIGITKGKSNRDVLKRTAHFKGYETRIQKLVYGTLEEIYYLEQYLHELWEHKRYYDSHKFGGHTELFNLDDEIIQSIPAKV